MRKPAELNSLPRAGSFAAVKSGYPGMRLLVSYNSDPGWHHGRVVLWMISKTRFVVLTPDGDMYDERLRDHATVMIMTGRLNYPDGVINVVAFEAALENADLADYITQGRLEAERIVKAEGLVSPPLPVSHIDWGGDDIVLAPPSVRARARHRIWGKTAVKKLPPSCRQSLERPREAPLARQGR